MATAAFSRAGSDDSSVARPGAPEGDPLVITPEQRESIQVLVIDDDRTLREGCASMLQMTRYNASFVGRADEPVELLKRRLFDIFLCDLYMTGVSRISLLRSSLTSTSDLTVIV